MGRRIGPEDFAPYERWLSQRQLWPTEEGRSVTEINEMVPRHAASALAKLLRWSETHTARMALNMIDHRQRAAHVRSSQLGRALAERSQSMPVGKDAVLEDFPKEVTPREMILAFAPIVAENTDLSITAIFTLCEALATAVDEKWTVAESIE